MVHNTLIKQLKGYKMKILKTLAIVTVSGIMATTAVVAEPMGGGHSDGGYHQGGEHCKGGKHHKGKMHQNMKVALKAANVTSEQKAAIKEARKAMRTTMRAKHEEMKASGRPQFMTVNGVDRTTMINKAVEMATFRANLRADMMEKVLATLTAQQRVQFIQALQAN